MTPSDAVAVALQLVVPIALIAGLVIRRRAAFVALETTFAALYLAAIWLAGLWLPLPRYLVGIHGVLLAAAVVFALRGAPVRRLQGALGRGGWVRLAMVAVAAVVVLQAGLGRRPLPGSPLDLEFPLSDGTYLVASGGSTTLLNPHLGTLEPERSRPWRGQSYAVDLVEVGTWGSRVRAGTRPAAYAVFGAPVAAPCAGTVVRALDGRPDVRTGGERPDPLQGNHVILQCGGSWIVLAHLQRGSVGVTEGQDVASGALLGRVGNSGRSDEPHLHIHAQTPGTAGQPLSGSPIPVTFDGRHLVRNDRVHASRLFASAVETF